MMVKRNIWVLVVLMTALLVLNGCGALAAMVVNPGKDKMSDYNISADNQSLLQMYAEKGYRVNIGKFTDASKSNETVKCRLMTSVHPPKDETYAKYIELAFQKEFAEAKLYDTRSKIILSATIDEIKGGTVYGDAYWSFVLTLASSNGKSYRLTSTYEYASSVTAAYACSDMYRTFPLAVQKLIRDALKDPGFSGLLQH